MMCWYNRQPHNFGAILRRRQNNEIINSRLRFHPADMSAKNSVLRIRRYNTASAGERGAVALLVTTVMVASCVALGLLKC